MRNNLIFLAVVVIVACTSGISSDIYAPSIPAIAKALNTTINHVQASMAIFMFGLALSQLVYGPIADVCGRKKPLIFGMILFVIGNIIIILTNNIFMLNFGRLVQGLGAGASASIWRAMFRDKYSGADMVKYGGYFTIAMTFMVPSAPLIGGYLQEFFSWKASFVFMIVYASIGIVLTIILMSESHDINTAHKFSLKTIFKNFFKLMTHKIFVGYTFCSFLCFGAFFSWFVIGPVLIIHQLGHTPSFFGWFTLIGGGGAIAISGYVNGKFVKKYGSEYMLKLGWSIMFIAGGLLLGGFYFFGVSLFAIFIPIILFYFGAILVFPNVFSQAFNPFGHMAGTAAALYSCLQTSGAVITSSIAAYIPDENQVPLAIIMMIAPMLSWMLYKILKLSKQVV